MDEVSGRRRELPQLGPQDAGVEPHLRELLDGEPAEHQRDVRFEASELARCRLSRSEAAGRVMA